MLVMFFLFENITDFLNLSDSGGKKARAEVVVMIGREAEARTANEAVNVKERKARVEKESAVEVKNGNAAVQEAENVDSEAVTEAPSMLCEIIVLGFFKSK